MFFTTTTFFLLVLLAQLPHLTVIAHPSSIHHIKQQRAVQSKQDAGIIIPLFKRSGEPDDKSAIIADFKTIQHHVAQVEAKYQQGILNWQANTGSQSLWARPRSSESTTVPQSSLSPVTSSAISEEGKGQPPSSPAPSTETETGIYTHVFNASEIQKPVLAQNVGRKNFRRRGGLLPLPATSPSTSGNRNAYKSRQAEPLINENNDQLWAGTITIGNPPQSFLIDFDTFVMSNIVLPSNADTCFDGRGSADLWIPSVSCQSQGCTSHKKYEPSASSSSQQQSGQRFQITYGDGTTSSGNVYTDDVSVAGLTAVEQTFSAVDQVSDSFQYDVEDGILGLAFQSISELDQPPYFQTLVNQGQVASPMFSFRLAKTDSELYLGGANTARYVGDIDWHPLTSQSYWLITGQVSTGGKAVPLKKPSNTIIDSGTTVIVAPPADARAFWQSIPGSKPYSGSSAYWTYPCNSNPNVGFAFAPSNKIWYISARDFNLGRVSSGSDRCVGAVVGQDVGINAWVLGDSFMKSKQTTKIDANESMFKGRQPVESH